MTLHILHPPIRFRAPFPSGGVHDSPEQVLRDTTLTKSDKRSLLSSWASDAHAVENKPWLRQLPGWPEPIPLTAILNALRRLDDDDPPPRGGAVLRVPARLQDNIEVGRLPPRWMQRPARRHSLGKRVALGTAS